jgi:hypothetical protein
VPVDLRALFRELDYLGEGFAPELLKRQPSTDPGMQMDS